MNSATKSASQSRQPACSKFTSMAFYGIAASLVLGMSSASFASPISVSSALDLVATTGRSTFEVIDSASASQGATINNLGTLSANAVSTSAGGTSKTSGSALATWTSTAQGQVRFENVGWDNSAFTPTVVSASSLAGTQWTYTFVADVTGQFMVNWDVFLNQPVSDSFGLNDFRFSLSGAGGGQTIMGVNSTGSATRNIFAGNLYTAMIHTDNGIFGGVGGRTSFMNGIFDWSMDSGPPSSVSEPGPIALMAMGLLCLVWNKRNRGSSAI